MAKTEARILDAMRRATYRLRMEVLAGLARARKKQIRCECCGEGLEQFLTIDHIDGRGSEHRRELKLNGRRLYDWLKANNYPPNFRLLCFNCNSGRAINGGECPHKDPEGRLTAMEGGRLQQEEDQVEINAVLSALVGFRERRTDLTLKEAESGAKAAESGDFGLSPQQIETIGKQVPPDHSALIILFENLWERRFKEIIGRYRGDLIVQKAILPEQLARFGKELAEREKTETGEGRNGR